MKTSEALLRDSMRKLHKRFLHMSDIREGIASLDTDRKEVLRLKDVAYGYRRCAFEIEAALGGAFVPVEGAMFEEAEKLQKESEQS